MSDQSRAAERFQADVIRRSDAVTRKALGLWAQVPTAELDAGWAAIEGDLMAAVSAVAAQNAAASQTMVNKVGRADRVSSGDVIIPNAFTGVDSTGREASGLLHGAVTTTKQGIGRGMSQHQAFLAGASYLAAMTKTLVADMARSSGSVAAAGRGYTRYVRVVNAGACDRCAILAGSYRFSKPFQRHPACRCTSVPTRDGESVPDGLYASPREHFDALSESEQNRIYGRAGAEAIRLGADPIQVVGARRGASGIFYSRAYPASLKSVRRMQRVPIGVRPDGSQIMGYTTLEGTTKRGWYGRKQRDLGEELQRIGSNQYSSTRRSRLMPESILEATSDPNMRRTLLRDAGYLDSPRGNMSGADWYHERLRLMQLDRVAADTFYKSLGIDLY